MLHNQGQAAKAVKLLAWKPRFSGFVDHADRCFAAWKAHARVPST